MRHQHQRIFWLIVILALGGITIGNYGRTLISRSATITEGARQEPAPAPPPGADRSIYIRAGALWPQLRGSLKALGDRLEKAGKERLTFAGTLSRVGEPEVAFMAISEFPDRLKLIMRSGGQARTIVYDGQEPIPDQTRRNQ